MTASRRLPPPLPATSRSAAPAAPAEPLGCSDARGLASTKVARATPSPARRGATPPPAPTATSRSAHRSEPKGAKPPPVPPSAVDDTTLVRRKPTTTAAATPPPVPSPTAVPEEVRAELEVTLAAMDAVAAREAALLEKEDRAREAHALVEAARGGDPRAFEALVRRYRPRIFALALHMTGSPSDADDITQDAFVRAFRNIERFEGRSEFFTWLYRIALNRALNVRRDRSRRRTADLDDPRVTVAVAVDSGGDPHRALELRQTYSYLVRAFDRLSPLLKTTIALTMMQGLSYPEAAVVLETTEGTIAWRIHEARKQMRVALDAMFKDPTSLRAADLARAHKAAAEARQSTPDASPPPSLEMALALLAPTV